MLFYILKCLRSAHPFSTSVMWRYAHTISACVTILCYGNEFALHKWSRVGSCNWWTNQSTTCTGAMWISTLRNHVLPIDLREKRFLHFSFVWAAVGSSYIVEPAHFVFSYAGQQNNLINLIWCAYGHLSDFVFILMPLNFYLLINCLTNRHHLMFYHRRSHPLCKSKLPNLVVHSNQIGLKCNQIFTDAIIFKHALAICDWKICQLIAKLQYCDNHKSFKSYI